MQPFDDVVTEHGTVVMRVCRSLLAPADAEDAWSDTFLAALRAYPELRPGSNVRGWLVTIAHRKAIDVLRRRRRAMPMAEVPERAHLDEPATDGALGFALAALPEKQRNAVLLRYLGDLAYADVAAEMGTSLVAARKNASDGVAALRRSGLIDQGDD